MHRPADGYSACITAHAVAHACRYSFYLAIMYIMFIGLLAVVALSAYVGWSVQNNRLDSAWWVHIDPSAW
jgi:hypothetical protein